MNLIKTLSGFRHHYNVTRVTESVKAAFSGQSLPPGKFLVLDLAEQSDQKFLLRHSEKVGPVFKLVFEGKLTICVIGLALCRRFLQENSANMKLQAINLEELFPLGFLRRMEGEAHEKYRTAIIRGIDSGLVTEGKFVYEEIIAGALARYAEQQGQEVDSAESYISTLNNITSSLLISIFFGVRAGSGRFEKLLGMYDKLGPHEVEWSIGEQQKESFFEIRDYLLQELDNPKDDQDEWFQQGIIWRMHKQGALDETSLGNLIYMVEIGRYDMRLLFRWLSKYGAENPDVLERIRNESPETSSGRRALSQAFVLETLRLSQSEVLMRVVDSDIVFEGYQIPKNFVVRLCIWESHKSPGSFDHPFSFKPERFTEGVVNKEQFSAFGLDHHGCPFGAISTRLSAIFIDVLARNYDAIPVANSSPFRGRYHWQPANSFSVRLTERQASQDTAPPRTVRPRPPVNKGAP
jgi:cytochrome P450